MVIRPRVHRLENVTGLDVRAVMEWRFDTPLESLSSASVGGGWRRIDWLLNVGVPGDYFRTDLESHARDVARHLGLTGPGQVLLTAADVTMAVSGESQGVHVDASVGITKPTWAADEDDVFAQRVEGVWVPGTINIVVQLPVALTPAAAVNAVMTTTEAKTQALLGAAIPGTGTASDAVTILWPATSDDEPEPFAGPRSPWGARIARAVHNAVVAGIEVHP